MRCKICRFWRDRRYLISEKEQFEKLAREGVSLRKLEIYFQALHFTVKKNAISSHIKNCMNIQVSQQRGIEKSIKKEGIKKLGKKLGGFFIPKKKEPMIPTECPHTVTIPFFDLSSERVHVRCRQCGKILFGSADPHKKQKRRRKDLIVYGSLRK